MGLSSFFYRFNPKVIQTIEYLNQELLSGYGLENKIKELKIKSYGIDVNEVVAGGDILACGDLSMEIVDVPGHSSCSIAVYVSRQKAMFASDAGGVPFGDRIFTAANSNYDKYQESLQKMASYEIEVYLAEHFGARTGNDARHFLQKSMDTAMVTRSHLEASYAKTKDIEKSTKEVTDSVLEWMPEDFMPKEIMSMVVGQMIRFIAGLK